MKLPAVHELDAIPRQPFQCSHKLAQLITRVKLYGAKQQLEAYLSRMRIGILAGNVF